MVHQIRLEIYFLHGQFIVLFLVVVRTFQHANFLIYSLGHCVVFRYAAFIYMA